MKHQIKNRWTGDLLFEADVPDGTASGRIDRVALEQAVASDADLSGAYLSGAYLSGADLSGADLRGANLRDAYLSGANLSDANLRDAYLSGANLSDANLRYAYLLGAALHGANLRYADLRGAYLSGADLSCADLRGADLRGANLRDDLKLVGDRPILSIGPIGSVGRTIFAWITDQGLRIEAGCFFGTRDEFVAQLEGEHGDNIHGKEYRAALVLIDAHFELWSPAHDKGE